MINSRQRAQLRALANTINTILIVGKGGVTENVVTQATGALKARELVKGRTLENSMLTPREVCDELCRLCRAEPVQVIGSKFVIYRENHEIPREKRIALVK